MRKKMSDGNFTEIFKDGNRRLTEPRNIANAFNQFILNYGPSLAEKHTSH